MRKLSIILVMVCACMTAMAQHIVHLGRYAASNQELPAPEGPRVVLFGDSITDGWASQRPEFFAENGFVGRGISGEETSQMLLRFRADVLDIGASIVVILAGINDIAMNLGDPYSEELTYANILSMTDLAWQNGVRPVICSLLPSYRLGWRPEVSDVLEKVRSLNARLQTYCNRHGITYIDYGAVLMGPDGKILPAYSSDTVHPNAEGYAVMEKLLLESLH